MDWTDVRERFEETMVQLIVNFIGGDFNMSAFSTVSDVFSDPEFAAPGNSLLCGLGGLDDTCRECTSPIIMPRQPHAGGSTPTVATSPTMLTWALGRAT